MLRFGVGAFVVLHGLVHLLYFGQSRRLVELRPGMVWPDGSWAFSALLGERATRLLASASCVVAAIGFVVSGTAILTRQAWWRGLVLGAAAFSTMVLILLWDGKLERLDDQGGIAILINVVIVAAVLFLRWSSLGL